MLLFYMLDEDDLLKKEKPFKVREIFLPGILDIAAQIEFLRMTLPNPSLHKYANLPASSLNPEISSSVLDSFNTAAIKLRTLLGLMETTEDAQSLFDSVNDAASVYRNIYPQDYQGLEVIFLNGEILVSIFDENELALQVILKKQEDGCWQIGKCMFHFVLAELNIEIRDDLRGNESIVVFSFNPELPVVPGIRDTVALASLKIPSKDSEDVRIDLFKNIKTGDAQATEYYDYFTIVPYKKRLINIYKSGVFSEQIVITVSDYGITIQMLTKEIQVLPTGQIEVMSKFSKIEEAPIDIDALKARSIVKHNNNLTDRATLVRSSASELPRSTKIEVFAQSGLQSFEVRFRDDMSVQSIVFNNKVYIDGEFNLYLSTDGYYIFILGDTQQRIPVNFNADYTMEFKNAKILPVFKIIDLEMGVELTRSAGQFRIISLN